jgi:hypothetical protein
MAAAVFHEPFVFEPVHVYLDRYDIADVLCFSTDYPHVEGGSDPLAAFGARLAGFGPEVVEKFFVTNGDGCCRTEPGHHEDPGPAFSAPLRIDP